MFELIGLGFITLLILIFLGTSFVVVQQNDVALYSILGKYKKIFEPGLHLRIPMISSIRRVSLAQQPLELKEQTVISKDNAEVHVGVSLTFHVTDAYKYAFENTNSLVSMEQQTRSDVRDIIGKMDLNDVLNSAESINAQLSSRIASITDVYGLNVDRINIDQLDPSTEIQGAMNKLVTATRERDAQISAAEGKARAIKLENDATNEAMVTKAKANAEAVRTSADAEAYRVKTTNDALNSVTSNYLVAQNIDAFKELANSRANTVVLPSTTADNLASVPAMQALMQATNSDKQI